MSDSEEEMEVEAEEAVQEKPKPRPPPPPADDGETMTEAEKAMMAAKKRHEEEREAKLAEFAEERAKEREKEEQELAELKERQEARKAEAAEELAKIAEFKAAEEERRKQDEEARKAKQDEKKKLKEAEKAKRMAAMAGSFGLAQPGGKNFTVGKKEGGILGAAEEKKMPGGTKEEHEAAKKAYMAKFTEDFAGQNPQNLKEKIKQLHNRLTQLEGVRYDLQKRVERQEYDARELHERERQQARKKAEAKGLDAEEAGKSPHPPKINTYNKFDRQIDRRSYGDRKDIYEGEKKSPLQKIFHGSAKPPTEWGRPAASIEELETLRKNFKGFKYAENEPVEGAKPPMDPVPTKIPE